MTVNALIVNQSVQLQQPAAAPSGLEGIVKKISEVVLSRWDIVAATALVAGACFGVVVGLGVAAVGALILMLVSKRNEVVVPGGVVPAPVAQVPGDPNSREYNVRIFQQTLAMIQEGLHINLDQHRQMLEAARVVPEILGKSAVRPAPVRTQFIVESITTYEMTRKLVQQGHRPLVLDMANRLTRGGGVVRGARAQEETICRQSNLYPAFEKLVYPLPERGGALVPGVQFFRDDAYNIVKPFVADVFVSAAYNCNRSCGNGCDRPDLDKFYAVGTDAKIRTMLRAAIQNGNRTLVLSAFGCGAFKNDPNFIAGAYKRIFAEAEFAGAFDIVAFGIYDPPGAAHLNCPVFRDVFADA